MAFLKLNRIFLKIGFAILGYRAIIFLVGKIELVYPLKSIFIQLIEKVVDNYSTR
ncbi:uncharacterized protein SN13T_0779 [Lactiplantibacillus plantarum]|nr:uncharacterized protein SN13T_0779 [Lactiplantibacillus plantarum]